MAAAGAGDGGGAGVMEVRRDTFVDLGKMVARNGQGVVAS